MIRLFLETFQESLLYSSMTLLKLHESQTGFWSVTFSNILAISFMSVLTLTTIAVLVGYARSRSNGSWDETQQQIKKFTGKYDEALKGLNTEHI